MKFLNVKYNKPAQVFIAYTLNQPITASMTASGLEPASIYFINEHSRPVWLNGWVFVYEVNHCGFMSRCSRLNFKFRACFEQGVPWHSGIYRLWIHSEMRTWHDNNMQHLLLLCFFINLNSKIPSLKFLFSPSKIALQIRRNSFFCQINETYVLIVVKTFCMIPLKLLFSPFICNRFSIS